MAIDPLDRYLVRVDVNGYFPGIGYICEASTAPPTDGVTVILKRTIDVEGTFIGSETPSGAGWLYLQSGTELQTLGSSQCDHLVRDGIPPAARLGGSTRVTSRGTFLLHAVRSGYMRAEWVPDFGVGPRIVELMIPEPPGRVEVQLGK